ncbi:hypothetical protein HERIO_1167 [Hepatospora eriocheir]|uniref:Uncharacterized protein n=1 Tax=Hepatospora eriocheir TaxID=1081669 RepID=A0A1X0QB43_9MICR|nr:hypothetical protein HERIO_1167 [Hepatospora eriocheir]
MKKSFRPIARVQQKSELFENRRLNVNENFGIKTDEYGMEDINDYFNVANSIIAGHNTIDSRDNKINTESLRYNISNIENKYKNDDILDTNNQSVSNHWVQSFNNEIDLNLLEKNLTEEMKKEKDSSSASVKFLKNNSDTRKINEVGEIIVGNSDELDNKFETKNISNHIDDFGIDVINNENDCFEINNNSFKSENNKQSDMLRFSSSKSKKGKESLKKKLNNSKKKLNKKSESSNKKLMTGDERLEPINFFDVKSTGSVSGLIENKNIGTAAIILNSGDLLEQENIENNMIFHVMSGKVKVKTNQSGKTILKKGSVFSIVKGDSFTMNCKSINVAKLLMFYSIE